MRRSIDSVDFQRFSGAGVDDVMSSSWRDDNSISSRHSVLISIYNYFSISTLKSKKLVSIGVNLLSYVFTYLETHKHKLHMLSSVVYLAKIIISKRLFFQVSKKSFHSKKVKK